MYCARSARPVSRCIAFHCVCRYVGIIDFLQQWNLQKRAERNWKVEHPHVAVGFGERALTALIRFT